MLWQIYPGKKDVPAHCRNKGDKLYKTMSSKAEYSNRNGRQELWKHVEHDQPYHNKSTDARNEHISSRYSCKGVSVTETKLPKD